MRSEYEDIVRYVCGDNWISTDSDERDGGYGVALTLAYIRGVTPRLGDMASEIGTPAFVLEFAFRRLQVNGIFCSRSPVSSDPDLFAANAATEEGQYRCLMAWCNIAGLSSGWTGKGFTRAEYAALKNPVA